GRCWAPKRFCNKPHNQTDRREQDEHSEKNQPRRKQRIIDRRRNIVKLLSQQQRNNGVVESWSSARRIHFITPLLHRSSDLPHRTRMRRSRKIERLKIRNEENHSASCDNFIQIIEGQRRLCAASLWFEKQNLPDKS